MHTVLFVHHGVYSSLGYLAERAAQRGFDVETVDFPTEESDPRTYSLIVVLGTPDAAYDDTLPWLAAEMSFVKSALAEDVPTFGVCFGGQLLARCLGGSVQPSSKPELGWTMVDTRVPDLVDPGPWFEMHGDTITLPADVVELARNDAGVQAFQQGRALGVQFHPEVNAELIAEWLAAAPDFVARVGGDAEAVLADTRTVIPEARMRAHRLFDRVWERIGS